MFVVGVVSCVFDYVCLIVKFGGVPVVVVSYLFVLFCLFDCVYLCLGFGYLLVGFCCFVRLLVVCITC